MQTYDIVMIAVLGVATLFGLMKGFAWQLASVASLVLSYFCALRFADQLAPQLNVNPVLSKPLAMLIIYCGSAMAVWIALRFISATIDRIDPREFDRQLGGLLGLAKGALLCTVITFFAVSLNADTRAAVLKSKSGYYISAGLHQATPIMPPEWLAQLKPYLDRLQQGLDPNKDIEPLKLDMPNLVPEGLQQPLQQLQQYQQSLPQNYGPPQSPGGYQQPGYQQPGYQQNYQQNYQPQPGAFVPNGGAPSGYQNPYQSGGTTAQQPSPYYVPPSQPQTGGYPSGMAR